MIFTGSQNDRVTDLIWGLYSGRSAQMVENSLGIHGDEILYVGDHIYTDVSVSKVHLRWRTTLICRELEEEYNALMHSREHRGRLVELINQKEVIGDLFNQLRLALQRRNMGRLAQETLLNLLLRNYPHYNLYDQAEKLRSKAPRFEAYSNQQFCRYLFYLGKIRTIQLEYTDAKESLLQAARKALGFRVECNKWAVIVRLLLGEIPERTVFMQKGGLETVL
ncbi:probable 26S proteasome non-ATPase regulatory subunit 3 [Tanacetum coccineum]